MELESRRAEERGSVLDATGPRSDTGTIGHAAGSRAAAMMRSSILNLANTILGAGMLGLPHAIAQCGLAVGIFLLLVFALLSALGLYCLSAACDVAGRPASFRTVAERALPGSGMLLSAAIAIKCFGVGTSYLIVVGDMMPPVLSAWGVPRGSALLDRRLWSLVTAVGVAPLLSGGGRSRTTSSA